MDLARLPTARRPIPGVTLPILLAAILHLPSCGEDKITNVRSDRPPSLSSRSGVIRVLDYAYFNRDISTFESLLDSSFTFVFQEGEAIANPDVPESWTRQDEIAATTNLFDENYQDPDMTQNAADAMELLLFSLDALEDSTWQVYTGPMPFPDIHTWYEWRPRYHFEVAAGQNLYISDDQATFVVRPVDVGGTTEWRLVIWADLELSLVHTSGATEVTTWGRIKTLYFDPDPGKDEG
jgi:hypothetical protein